MDYSEHYSYREDVNMNSSHASCYMQCSECIKSLLEVTMCPTSVNNKREDISLLEKKDNTQLIGPYSPFFYGNVVLNLNPQKQVVYKKWSAATDQAIPLSSENYECNVTTQDFMLQRRDISTLKMATYTGALETGLKQMELQDAKFQEHMIFTKSISSMEMEQQQLENFKNMSKLSLKWLKRDIGNEKINEMVGSEKEDLNVIEKQK